MLLFISMAQQYVHELDVVMYKFLAFLGSAASYCSTLNLGIRSYVPSSLLDSMPSTGPRYIIWKDMNRVVVWVLSLGFIGHAALVGVRECSVISPLVSLR